MKKASKIMYLVSMILNIVGAVAWFIYGIAVIVVGCIPEIKEAFIEAAEQVPNPYRLFVFGIFAAGFIAGGIICFIACALTIVSAVLCHKGRTDGSRKIYILNIVFGALSSSEVAIAASILAIISDNKERNRKEVEVEGQIKEEAK